MTNKMLDELVHQRLSEELEKIKLALFEDGYESDEINEAVDGLKKKLANESTSASSVEPVIPVPIEQVSSEPPVVTVINTENAHVDVEPVDAAVINSLPTEEQTAPKDETKTHYDLVKVSLLLLVVVLITVVGYFLMSG